MRCKHHNGKLTEITEYVETVTFADAKPTDKTWVEYDAIQGYSFCCYDCGRVWTVKKVAKKPAWLARRIQLVFGSE
jgi:hypothetical protein